MADKAVAGTMIQRAVAQTRRATTKTTAQPVASLTVTHAEAVPGPLTKEQAMADTMRALQQCYPDRWERVWDALGKESASDRVVAELSKTAASDPGAALGAIIGGAIGAALGKIPKK